MQSKLNFKSSLSSPMEADKEIKHVITGAQIASRKRASPLSPRTTPNKLTILQAFKTSMDSSFDLPDSTDWLATSLPSFEPLEASIRCEVCKEFYNNPVITQCSHTFCSICIRRCITADGKCPACKTNVSSERLVPNIAVREIVKHFQAARPKALELAQQKQDDENHKSDSVKKRKLDDTDLEDSESGRQPRSRRTRSSRLQGGDDSRGSAIVVPDSEDESDADFEPEQLPEGMVRCPICQKPMKEELVYPHLNNCPGPPGSRAGSGRSTRSRMNVTVSKPTQHQSKQPSHAPSRLPQLSYHLLKEAALKKKLQELGIPTWGKKELLERRHTEWLHIWNSNCDSENPRSKRELLKELDIWEQTRGGSARIGEAKVMRKDFDAQGHATTHRSQFDDLIANARKKRDTTKVDEEPAPAVTEAPKTELRSEPQPTTEFSNTDMQKPLEGNDDAIASIREKVEIVHRSGDTLASVNQEAELQHHDSETSASGDYRAGSEPSGITNPFTNPSRKVPMFALPEDPVVDMDSSTQVQ